MKNGVAISTSNYDWDKVNVTGISLKSGTVENCEIYNNSSLGIICRSSATASIENNLIYENYNGIGVYRAGAPSIVNNTITNNTIWGIKSLSRGTQTPTITNCIVWGNGYEQIHRDFMVTNYITYNCIENWASGGTGNIDVDPLFVDPVGVDGIIGTEDDDLRLQSGSLCIDAGDPNFIANPNGTDLDGNPRVAGVAVAVAVDMGAYEFVEAVEVSMKFTPQAVNLFARGKWVMGHIVLPEGFSVADVDAGAGARLEPFGVDSHHVDVFVNDDGMVEVEAVFDRSQLWGYAANGPTPEVTVSGKFVGGQCFYGRDTIKIMLMLEYFEKLSLHWLEMDCGAPDWCDGADADHSSVVDMGDLILNE